MRGLYGPAELGRPDEPPEPLRRRADAERSAHQLAWETVVDSRGRRYVRARRWAPEGATRPPPAVADDDVPALDGERPPT